MQEMVKMANDAVDAKTKEILETRMQVEDMSKAVMERDMKINQLQGQIKQMQENLRGMTSFSGIDADETFEKVLRDEFDAMKKSYSSQVANLEEEVHKHKTDLLRVKGDLQSEIESLTMSLGFAIG